MLRMFQSKSGEREPPHNPYHHPETKHANGFRNVKELCQDIEYKVDRYSDRMESKIDAIDDRLTQIKGRVDLYWSFWIAVIGLLVGIFFQLLYQLLP